MGRHHTPDTRQHETLWYFDRVIDLLFIAAFIGGFVVEGLVFVEALLEGKMWLVALSGALSLVALVFSVRAVRLYVSHLRRNS